ncbi:MAG: penicillin-binding transpeptidase domain-containing protein [Desulfovibrio sp.]
MMVKRNDPRDFSKVKLVIVAVFFGLLWTALWVQTGRVQIVKGPLLENMAARQNQASEFEYGERGKIYDRNGNLLATSVESKSVYVRPFEVTDRAYTARQLSKILDTSYKRALKRISNDRRFIWIKRQINDREAAEIVQARIPGVYMQSEYSRIYPNGHLAGQLLGFVGVDGKGLEGLERHFDDNLTGRKKRLVMQRDAKGRRLLFNSEETQNVNGKDVTLTLDANIQDAAELALARQVRKYDAKAGMAVVANAKSGEILALANYPFFNPNIYRKSDAIARRDRAVLDIHEPGSTMKPFLLAAALNEDLIKPEQQIYCENGKWKLGRETIRDTHKYEDLSVSEVLRYSSNIGMAKIGIELGKEKYYSYLRKLGFGDRLGLPLPAEEDGLLRPVENWSEFDLAAASFGQGVGITSIQLVQAYLCLTNDGAMRRVKLVMNDDAPADEKAQKAEEASSEEETTAADAFKSPYKMDEGEQVVSALAARQVLEMMRGVVEEDGTGRKVRIPGVPIAGKTGTAQKASKKGGYGDRRMASFVGILPANDPELIILVMVDEPQRVSYGSVVAGPAVREIAINTLAYYGKLPEGSLEIAETVITDGESHMEGKTKRPRSMQKPGPRVPNISGMPVRRAMEMLSRKGIIPVLKGNGVTVSKQKPAAGSAWPKDDKTQFTLWVS